MSCKQRMVAKVSLMEKCSPAPQQGQPVSVIHPASFPKWHSSLSATARSMLMFQPGKSRLCSNIFYYFSQNTWAYSAMIRVTTNVRTISIINVPSCRPPLVLSARPQPAASSPSGQSVTRASRPEAEVNVRMLLPRSNFWVAHIDWWIRGDSSILDQMFPNFNKNTLKIYKYSMAYLQAQFVDFYDEIDLFLLLRGKSRIDELTELKFTIIKLWL